MSHSPSKSGVHPSTSPVKPHLMASGSCQGSLVSPMQGTPGRRGHLSRRGAALDAGERLPPSPSDPQLGMDLRKTALLRSLLLRTEVRRPESSHLLRSTTSSWVPLACFCL